jgi:predicted NBD/HSP70 family sugar kinase
MPTETLRPALGQHGASVLPSVRVDSYNAEIKDDEGFVGDRASRGAFYEILDKWRKPLRKLGADPFGDEDTDDISKKKLDELLVSGDHEVAGVIQSAIEEFAQTLTRVVKRFLKLKAWDKTERIVIGGGFREARIGELAIGRAELLLKSDGGKVDLLPIRHHPDEAGLIGAAHLAPAWIFKAHDSILAVDIGGTNIRVGVVEPNVKKASDLSKARVWKSKLWRHADESPSREETVKRLVDMLDDLAKRAIKDGHALAPFVGIACPGEIEEDGDIAKGAQNLPGNWESSRFNLPERICEALPNFDDDHETVVLMHNDAVVQGLSEVPFMQDVKRWGVLTIGTGLGNARFTNRKSDED